MCGPIKDYVSDCTILWTYDSESNSSYPRIESSNLQYMDVYHNVIK